MSKPQFFKRRRSFNVRKMLDISPNKPGPTCILHSPSRPGTVWMSTDNHEKPKLTTQLLQKFKGFV